MASGSAPGWRSKLAARGRRIEHSCFANHRLCEKSSCKTDCGGGTCAGDHTRRACVEASHLHKSGPQWIRKEPLLGRKHLGTNASAFLFTLTHTTNYASFDVKSNPFKAVRGGKLLKGCKAPHRCVAIWYRLGVPRIAAPLPVEAAAAKGKLRTFLGQNTFAYRRATTQKNFLIAAIVKAFKLPKRKVRGGAGFG